MGATRTRERLLESDLRCHVFMKLREFVAEGALEIGNTGLRVPLATRSDLADASEHRTDQDMVGVHAFANRYYRGCRSLGGEQSLLASKMIEEQRLEFDDEPDKLVRRRLASPTCHCERHRRDERQSRPHVVVMVHDLIEQWCWARHAHHPSRVARENKMLFSRWMCCMSSASTCSSPW